MKTNETNKRVAELLGWSLIEHSERDMLGGGDWCGYPPHGAVIGRKRELPDYTTDRNAIVGIFESVRTGGFDHEYRFMCILNTLITSTMGENPFYVPKHWDFMTVDPELVCTAFLMVNERWTE